MFPNLIVRTFQRLTNNRALFVADYIVARAIQRGDNLTAVRLMDIAYLCQGWHLEQHDKPLINRPFEAWRIGPVCQDIYKAYRHLRDGCVTPRLRRHANLEALSQEERDFIDKVYAVGIEPHPHQMRAHMDHVTPQHRIFRREYRAAQNSHVRDVLNLEEIKHRFQQLRWEHDAKTAA